MDEIDLINIVAKQMLPRPPKKVGVAVSGGGDSMALLALMAKVAQQSGIELHAISVDHGLRDGTQNEIKLATDLCGKLGVSHHVEYWSGWDGAGNLQSCARAARYELITGWAQISGISTIVLGHTADDQAETLLMRLARGSGVDGLAAMAPRRIKHGISWLRPLLTVKRATLRNFLSQKNLIWAEDPSNENRNFERIRVRDALAVLEPLGISVDELSDVAKNMMDARAALDWYTFLAAKEACEIQHGVVKINLKILRTLPVEISRRLLVQTFMWLNGSDYPPRRGGVEQVKKAIKKRVSATLDGCQTMVDQSTLYVFRELNAVRDMSCEVGDIWDVRWYITGPEDDPELEVRAIGEKGISKLSNWRDLGLPRAAILSLPAVWCGADLIAAPIVECTGDWRAELEGGPDAFFTRLLSH